jgi:plastocyanin
MTRNLIVVGLLLALAACGTETVTPSASETQTEPSASETQTEPSACDSEVPATATALTTTGTDNLRFDPDKLTAPAGEVHITLDNPSSLPHSFVLGKVDDFELDTAAGEECGGTVTLEPGSYAFWCGVAGHQEGGMKGTLVVE